MTIDYNNLEYKFVSYICLKLITMDYKKIKSDKIQEAKELYEKLGIDVKDNRFNDPDYYEEIPEVHEITDKKEDVIFHWTRLSNTSNIGCIVE